MPSGFSRGLLQRTGAARPEAVRSPVELVNLGPLMARTEGRPEVLIGLVDGPVHVGHPGLAGARIAAAGSAMATRGAAEGDACSHATFVAGVLVARRGSGAPAICPACTVVVSGPAATQGELASSIAACIRAGAAILNVSAAVLGSSPDGEAELRAALDQCARQGAIVVAAAGNQGMIASSALTRHPAVISVGACDTSGRVARHTNLSATMGTRGLLAPGERVTSLDATGGLVTMGGSSAAAPFVTGTLALLQSVHPGVSANALRVAVTRATGRRASLVPPLLDAEASARALTQRSVRDRR